MEAAASLDTVGLIARSVEDIALYCDVLLSPSAAGEAPAGLNATGNASHCVLWTSTHVPCMTLPLFSGPN
jgi:Asp-tRNA(Asn)/Glu-tRNA(Gln) amidotransferase A subunit family amidase